MKIRKVLTFAMLLSCPFVDYSFGQKVKPRPATAAQNKSASPAEKLFSDGLKCEAKDYDCQVSNYTKAINLGLATKAVFQKRAVAFNGREEYDRAIGDLTKAIELDLNDANGFKERAKAYMGMKRTYENLQAAIKDLSSSIDLEPKDVEAYNLRGSAYLSAGMTEKATADLDKALSIAPANADTLITRGDAYLRTRDLDKAIETYSKAIELKPDSIGAYNGRSRAYLQQKKTDLALADINKVVQIDPKQVSALDSLAELMIKQKKYDEAIAIYSKLVDLNPKSSLYLEKRGFTYLYVQKYEETIRDTTKALELNPASAKAFDTRCGAYFTLKEMDKAADDCDRAIALDPKVESAYIYRATLAYSKTNDLEEYKRQLASYYSNVLASVNQKIQRDGPTYEDLVRRGGVHGGLENYTAAIADFTAAIQLEPDSTDGYTYRAMYYMITKNYPAALGDYNALIRLRPESADGYSSRAGIYSLMQNKSAAEADYLKAIDLEPKKEILYLSLYSTHMSGVPSDANWSQNVGSFGVQIYTRGIAANPDSILLYTQRGGSYKLIKDSPNAMADYTKAIELFIATKPKDKESDFLSAVSGLADLYREAKDIGKAIETFTKGIEILPNAPLAYYNRGQFYRIWLKDSAKALVDFTAGSQAGTDAAYQKLNIDAIASLDKDKADALRAAAAEKERKRQARNATLNALFGVAVATVDAYAKSKGNTTSSVPTTPTVSTPTSTRTTTPSSTTYPSSTSNGTATGSVKGCTPNDGTSRSAGWSSCAVEAGEVGALFAGTVVSDPGYGPYDWNECSQADMDGYKRCWGGWMQSGLSQVSFRLRGPFHSTNSFKEPYYWTVGFKNNTNGIVSFSPRLIFGDGTDASHNIIILVPGAEYKWSAGSTASSSATASLQMPKWAYCPNASRAGGGYRCN